MVTIAEKLAAKLAEAEKRATAAEALVSSEDFAAEETARKKLAELAERERVARDRKRAADVARLLDDAHDRLGEDAEIEAVTFSALPDVFVVRGAGSLAFRTWEKGIHDAAIGAMRKGSRQRVDTDDVSRSYVAAGIESWSGAADLDDETTDAGARLNTWLVAHPAAVTELQQVITRLDGAASEARKR